MMLGFGKSFDLSKDIPDLSGKVALVTGGNAGIGFQIVQHLAVHGAKVYLGARSEERAAAAIVKIEETYSDVKDKKNVIWLPLDLTHPTDIVKSARDFISREDRLDILVNNAARLADDYVLSNGIELSIAINHVGHQVLVEQLMPILKATASQPKSDVRICILSSHAHYGIRNATSIKTVEDLNLPWPSFARKGFIAATFRYSWTKLLNEWFKVELQRRLDAEGINIIVLSAHPGLIATENNILSWPTYLRPFLWIFGQAPEVGGNSALVATTSPAVKKRPEKYKGAYLNERGVPIAASAIAQSKERASELWTLTSELIGKVVSS